MDEGYQNAVLNMPYERADHEPALWLIGQSLRYYYEDPTLPPKLLTLVRKLEVSVSDYYARVPMQPHPDQHNNQDHEH